MEMAIDSEARRQVELLESDKLIQQETRLFDTKKRNKINEIKRRGA